MSNNKSSHSVINVGDSSHLTTLNGKAQHTHIPRQYNPADQTFNSFKIPGGGVQECGICGEVLADCMS